MRNVHGTNLSCRSGLFPRWFVTALVCGVIVLPASAHATANETVGVRVLESTSDRIVIQYELGPFATGSVAIAGHKYTRIALGKESLMKRKGAPELPNICRSVVIPDNARMIVRVLKAEHYDITDIDVSPSKGYISRQVNPADVPYTFGRWYNENTFYPARPASLRRPYILRDCRGVVIDINPFRYNPVTRTLRVYTAITVEIVAAGPGKDNVLTRDTRRANLSQAFHTIYKHQFLNYRPSLRYDPMDETGDMLIICHDAWLPNIGPLVDHKNSRGINTTAVGVSTIGNNATSIKSYIQNVYDTSDLAFVLLVGDVDQVDTPYASGGVSDPTYSKLAGDDDYPDIIVGRFSAETAAHVDTQVERTIEYETLPAINQDWFRRGMGVASDQGTGDDGEYDYEHIDYIRDDMLAHNYTEVDQIYDPTATASMVTTGLNNGRGIINYCGHGGITSWTTTGFSNSNIDALTNDNMLPFIVSVACNNGEFDGYTTCFAETWLRATHNGEPTGAVGCYASSVSQYWTPPMEAQDEFNLLLLNGPYTSYGALCFAGSCSMMDDYPDPSGEMSGVETFDTWHIFGDPSLRVVPSCSGTGTVSLDRNDYACEDTVQIQVIDSDLNTNSGAPETVTVTIRSDSEPTGETVLLTETGQDTDKFVGSISVSETNAAGVLMVTEADTITVTYIDADDGHGNYNVEVTDNATVDCVPPEISNIHAENIETRSAIIVFDANEPVLGTIHYGEDRYSLTETIVGSGYSTSPAIGLSDLNDDVTYYYVVEAEDEAGNSVTEDNRGICFTFTTLEIPDFFTEIFESNDNDLNNLRLTFTPDEGISSYSVCVKGITELPTNPNGGTNLPLSDDTYATVNLTGGKTVSLYGQSYGCFYPGSNGYITFNHGATSAYESLTSHFCIPRISGLYDNLDPSAGGTVSWKQIKDRVVVTWLDVPEYGTSNENTFQIEMFFDGTITISYLTIEATDGLVGLSDGNGVDPEFLESDLSESAPCAPEPPIVHNMGTSTAVDTPVTVVLNANDDGLPNPPGALTYIVTLLPGHGDLSDPSCGPITEAPYTLCNYGNEVTYQPDPGYANTDCFHFKANDGGTPPEGGDSNIGLVLLTVGGPNWDPVAYDVITSTGVSQPVEVTLNASDPNDDPLTYIIETLPTVGFLSEGSTSIETVPYTLAGEVVTYQPPCGEPDVEDNFNYSARDATAGSNIATVTVYANGPMVTGDFNGDGLVNLADLAIFTDCLSGPEGGTGVGCLCVDLNADGDVDLEDFATFQALFTE